MSPVAEDAPARLGKPERHGAREGRPAGPARRAGKCGDRSRRRWWRETAAPMSPA